MTVLRAVLVVVVLVAPSMAIGGKQVKQTPLQPAQESSRQRPLSERFLVLSKMTLDRMPGEADSFVEIYNAHGETVDASGLSIVCNDREVYAIPKGLQLPGRGILAIRFSHGPAGVLTPTGVRGFEMKVVLRLCNAAIVVTKPLVETPIAAARRRSGYCGLVHESSGEIHDFVRWGQDDVGGKYLRLAKNARILGEGWIYIGQTRGPGNPVVPPPPAALVRYAFIRGIQGWKVRPIEQAVPGRGNTLPPPGFASPRHGAAFANDDPMHFSLGVTYRLDLVQPVTEKMHAAGLYRLQIARDPQFTEVIYDQQVTGRVELKDLKPGRYFARAMLNAGGALVSSWSEPVYFSYY